MYTLLLVWVQGFNSTPRARACAVCQLNCVQRPTTVQIRVRRACAHPQLLRIMQFVNLWRCCAIADVRNEIRIRFAIKPCMVSSCTIAIHFVLWNYIALFSKWPKLWMAWAACTKYFSSEFHLISAACSFRCMQGNWNIEILFPSHADMPAEFFVHSVCILSLIFLFL